MSYCNLKRISMLLITTGMIVFGSCNTILLVLTNNKEVLGVTYYHYFFQTFLMFLAESVCLLVYFILIKFQFISEESFFNQRS